MLALAMNPARPQIVGYGEADHLNGLLFRWKPSQGKGMPSLRRSPVLHPGGFGHPGFCLLSDPRGHAAQAARRAPLRANEVGRLSGLSRPFSQTLQPATARRQAYSHLPTRCRPERSGSAPARSRRCPRMLSLRDLGWRPVRQTRQQGPDRTPHPPAPSQGCQRTKRLPARMVERRTPGRPPHRRGRPRRGKEFADQRAMGRL